MNIARKCAAQLAEILKKTENEIFLMMKRICLMEKKKKIMKKRDNSLGMVRNSLHTDIKAQNKKSQDDAFDLGDLDPKVIQYGGLSASP
jgi:hypothetical protein